jgi:hypothetical protein
MKRILDITLTELVEINGNVKDLGFNVPLQPKNLDKLQEFAKSMIDTGAYDRVLLKIISGEGVGTFVHDKRGT